MERVGAAHVWQAASAQPECLCYTELLTWHHKTEHNSYNIEPRKRECWSLSAVLTAYADCPELQKNAMSFKNTSSSSSSPSPIRPLGLFLPPENHLPISFVVFLYFFSLQVCNFIFFLVSVVINLKTGS